MSVIDVTKMWSKTGATFSSDTFSTLDAKYAYVEAWMVLCEIGDTPNIAIGAAGIPSLGEQHPSGVAAYAKTYNATPMGPILWQVTVNYEGVSPAAGEAEVISVEWSDVSSTEQIDRDFNGFAIMTANNEPVAGLTMDIADQTCVITRKFNAINTYTIAAYRHATNSDYFLGWPPGTARLVGFSAKTEFNYNQNLGWNVTARMQFRRGLAGALDSQAWYQRWRHEGLYIKDTAGGPRRRALDSTGQDMTKPVLLKADGTEETNPEAAVFNYTQVYGSLPYAGLGLI